MESPSVGQLDVLAEIFEEVLRRVRPASVAVLGGAGFVVEWIGDPLVAIDKIKSMPCLVLVLLDVMMPAENGFDVLRKIRAQPSMRKLPVIMLTAHETPEYVAEGLRGGADGYILKPFRPEKLIQYLHATLRNKWQE